MDWSVTYDNGLKALENGVASFIVVGIIAACIWGLYKSKVITGLGKILHWILIKFDKVLEKLVLITGVTQETGWKRWGVFILLFLILILIGAFAPVHFALGVIIFAHILILSIYRHWEKDENARLDKIHKGKTSGEKQALTEEMLIALGLLLFFIPLGFTRLEELFSVLSGQSPNARFDSTWYVWGELLKAVPLVDWSEVFGISNLSGVKAIGKTGATLTFIMRVLFDLLILSGLIRVISIFRNIASGFDIRNLEEDLKFGDNCKIETAIKDLGRLAGKGRRNSFARLFEITRGTRSDEQLMAHKWRKKASFALATSALTLTERADTLVDLDNRLLAIEAYKAAAQYMEPHDKGFWATAQNNLGIALASLGKLSGDRDALERALYAYRQATNVNTKKTMPTEWAMAQNNIGVSLQNLGEISGKPDLMKQAVESFQRALEIYTEDNYSVEWADTMNNIGTAYQELSEVSGETEVLELALDAYRKALKVRTKKTSPPDRADTLNNMGIALASIGEVFGDTDLMEQAITSYEEVLVLRNADDDLIDNAATQNNMGVVLHKLGEINEDQVMVERAIKVLKQALDVRTKVASPARWAVTKNNMGTTLLTLGEMSTDTDIVKQAITNHKNSLDIYKKEALPADWAMTKNNIGNALQTLADMYEDIDASPDSIKNMKRAIAAYEEALEVYTKNDFPADWAMTKSNMGSGLETLGMMSENVDTIKKSIEAFDCALEVYTEKSSPTDWAMVQNNMGNALYKLGRLNEDEKIVLQAISAYKCALSVRTKSKLPISWSATMNNKGLAFQTLGKMTESANSIQKAIDVFNELQKWFEKNNAPEDIKACKDRIEELKQFPS